MMHETKPYCPQCNDTGFYNKNYPGYQLLAFCICKEGQNKEFTSMRTFDTGATRDEDTDKLDYEGFLSPLVLRRYAEYLHKHRTQTDGQKRNSDNWQRGIPLTVYMKSMWRHFMDLWTLHRECKDTYAKRAETLCAVIFNASGYLHELLQPKFPSDPK